MTTRLLLLLIAVALLLAATGVAITHFQPTTSLGYTLTQWGLSGGQLAGLLLLVHTGSILGTRYFAGMAAGIALTLLGFLFTILHWQFGRPMLLLGLAGILLVYTIRFYHKATKTRPDWLKWLWVLTATVGAAGIMQHWLPREVAYVAQALFWLAVLEIAVRYRHDPGPTRIRQ